jgi:hypothetical protein
MDTTPVIPMHSVDDDVRLTLGRRALVIPLGVRQLSATSKGAPFCANPSTFTLDPEPPTPASLTDFEIGSTVEVFEPDGYSRGEFVVGRIADNGARFDARVLVKDGQVYSGVHLGRVLVPTRGLCLASDVEPTMDAGRPLGADRAVRS